MADKKSATLHTIINELVDRTNSDAQRLRIMEQRTKELSSRANTVEQELLNLNRQIQDFMSEIDIRIKRQEDMIRKSENVVKEVVKQMKKLATTSKISELEQLIEIYSPLKSQFVTREEVENIIEEKKNK
jgi:hypothetical protein